MPWLLPLLIGIIGCAAYIFWIRPLLRQRPSLKEFYDQEDSLWGAISLKTAGIKQHLTVAILGGAGVAVEAYDFIAPLLSQAGVDVTKIAPMIPPEAWPLINLGILALITYFRHQSDKRAASMIQVAAATGVVPTDTGLPGLPNLPKVGSNGEGGGLEGLKGGGGL